MGLSINLSRVRGKEFQFFSHDAQINLEAKNFGKMAYDAVGAVARHYQKEAYEKIFQASCTTNAEKKIKLIDEAAKILKYWGQGGINKVILHAFVGGTMAEISGNNFERGAVAAGHNEALQKELWKWEEKYPVEHQMISIVIGARIDELAGDGSNIGAIAALYGTKYNWDHIGHNTIIDSLYDPDDYGLLKILQKKYGQATDFENVKEIARIMRAEDTKYDRDILGTQLDSISHAMPFSMTANDYYLNLISSRHPLHIDPILISDSEIAEFRKEAERRYKIESEEYRCKIVKRCNEHLQAAINNPLNYKALTWAIHILTDDYAHRQNNGGWLQHYFAGINVQYLNAENVKTIIRLNKIDKMDYPENVERFQKAKRAAKEINDMFLAGSMGNID